MLVGGKAGLECRVATKALAKPEEGLDGPAVVPLVANEPSFGVGDVRALVVISMVCAWEFVFAQARRVVSQ